MTWTTSVTPNLTLAAQPKAVLKHSKIAQELEHPIGSTASMKNWPLQLESHEWLVK